MKKVMGYLLVVGSLYLIYDDQGWAGFFLFTLGAWLTGKLKWEDNSV